MNYPHAPAGDAPFAPAAFAARTHPFRAVALVTAVYLAVVACAPWLILEGPPVTPTPQIVITTSADAPAAAAHVER